MGAREKLNTSHIVGAIGAAGLLGLVTGSWILAVLAGAVLVGAAIHSGDVRFKGRR
ncbi:MAG: hypothetical protein ACLQNE_03720 [Thermoguttaceae bacterium]